MGTKRPIGIATADVHMQKLTHIDKRKMEWDALYGLEQVTDIAMDIGCRWIFMAGDNFNIPRPSPVEVNAMFDVVEKAFRRGLTIAYVRGQHDGRDEGADWLGLTQRFPTAPNYNDRTIWLHTKQVDIADIVFYGLDWLPREQLEPAMDTVPKNCDVMLMHQVWDEFMPASERFKPECSSRIIPGQVQMVITGDFHDHRSIIALNAGDQPIKLLSPGPVCMQNLAEPENKFCYVIYSDLTYESRKLKTRNCFRFLLKNEDELELFLKEYAYQCVIPQSGVPEYIAVNVVEIRYFDNIPECHQRLLRVLDKKVHHFLKPVPTPREGEELEAAVITKAMSLTDAVKCVPDVSDVARLGSTRLIEVGSVGGSISSELDAMRDEFYRAMVPQQ